MATYRVFSHDYAGVLGPNEIRLASAGADIPVNAPGDVFIIDPTMNGGFGFENNFSSSPIDVTIQFDASNTGTTGSETISIRPDISPTFTIADNVDVSNFDIFAPHSVSSMENFTLTLGNSSSLGAVDVGGSGTSGDALEISFTLGNDATIGTGVGDAISAGGGNLDFDLVVGTNTTLDGDLALGGSSGTYDVTFADGGTVNGNFTWGGSSNTYNGTFGDDFSLLDDFRIAGSGNDHNLSFGENALIAGDIRMNGGSNTNAIEFGPNATITGDILGSTSGSETWVFDRDWRIDGAIDLNGGNDVFILGHTSRDTAGTVDGGAGTDTIGIVVRTADEAAWEAAVIAAGWTDNGDRTYDTNGNTLVYKGNTYENFEGGVRWLCFGPETRIRTPSGAKPVSELKAGDLVQTLDHGALPIRWIGEQTLTFPEAAETQRPIMIRAGAVSGGCPEYDLVVSPQHRVLVKDADGAEHLGPAKGLLGLPGVRVMKGKRQVTYHTLLLDTHALIWAEGLVVESLLPWPEALKALGPDAGHEVMNMFPEVAVCPKEAFPPIRPLATSRQTSEMIGDVCLQD